MKLWTLLSLPHQTQFPLLLSLQLYPVVLLSEQTANVLSASSTDGLVPPGTAA